MTNEQKIQVVTLRAAGLSYAKIGERLGVSKDTVKTYARRHPVKEQIPMCITGACRNCGIKIEQLPGRKEKKFCSDKCRRTWWNTHLEQVNRKAYHTHICPQCGRSFESYGSKVRTYCSRACYAGARQKVVLPNG